MTDSLRYEADVDLSNKNNSHTLLVLLAGRDKKVLEVGPATGYVTRALTGRGCRVTCIEIDPEAAERARPHCERMIVGSVEDIDFDETFADEKFDVVIYGDVLEHLLNPESVLRKTARVLAPGGCVAASIPNIAHGSIRLALLRGDFRYTELGLLDRTHLRFFTRDSVAQLFEDAGYRIKTWRRVKLPTFSTEQHLKEEDYPAYLTEPLRDDPDAQTYQFIVLAMPRTGASENGAGLNSHERPRPQGRGPTALRGIRDQFEAREALIRDQQRRLDEHTRRIAELEGELTAAHVHINNLRQNITAMTSSIGWRLLKPPRAVIQLLLPPRSPQRAFFRLLRRVPGYRRRHGTRAILAKGLRVWEWPGLLVRLSGPLSQHLSLDEQYAIWLRRNAITLEKARVMRQSAATFTYSPLISIIIPVYNPEPALLRDAIESVRAQIYDNWEICLADDGSTREGLRELMHEYAAADHRIKVTFCTVNGGISAASNAALALATGEFVGLLDHDDELKPEALYEVVKLLADDHNLDFIYSDEDKKKLDGRLVQPFFKPDWSPDLLLCENYVTHFAVYRRRILEELGGFRSECDFSQDYDLVLRVTERTDRIAHIPLPLYSWRMIPGSAAVELQAKPKAVEATRRALSDAIRRRGLDAVVNDGPYPNTYRVRYRLKGKPLVSIIIPTRDRVELLRLCVSSIEANTTYPAYEIIIVDNDSSDQGTLDYLRASRHRCLPYPGPFNFAAMMNSAVGEAAGEYIILLNNDTEVITPDWIESMLEHSQRDAVAAVGARLLYPDGTPQHEGVIIGLGGGSALNANHSGYFGLGDMVLNCSAVTAACMMVRREMWERMEGFDESLGVAFNDVDFCLRARENGCLIVYTPYARLYHHESASRGSLHPRKDEQSFRQRWGKPGKYRDPYYNPNLSLIRPFHINI